MTGISAAAGTGGNASRRASAITVAVLCTLLAAKLAGAFASDEVGQVPFIVALFVLPLLYAVPGTRPLLARYTWPLLAVQAVLTFVPFALFGGQWAQGVAGLLAGLVLLTLPGRLSWPLAGLLLVADVAVRAGLVGLPWAPAWSGALWVVVVFVDDGLVFFGLVRLSDLVAELQSARGRFAELAVARERLQAAEDLQAAVGERLAGVAAMTAAAQRALPGNPAVARAQMKAAGVAARDAVARARAVTADRHMAPSPEPPAAATGADIAPRLAWAILVVILCGFGLGFANNIYLAHLDPGGAAALLASIAACVTLQLYHSGHAPEGRPPRAWPLTLAIQTALVYMPFVLLRGYVGSLAGFAAGSFLLLVPGRWRWAGYAAVVASWTALYAKVPQAGQPPQQGWAVVLYEAAAAAGVGLTVYGLSWLAGTARQLEALRGELARMAVLAERLRVARDVHDLLGLGLSAIALKSDLIGRLIGRDDTRAEAEIAEMGRICAHARADIRLVTQASRHLPLDAELAAAREILASAGVHVRADTGAGPLPAAADAVLAPVLREAVTNVLRHSAATACTIKTTTADGALRLHISNDGVPGQTAAGDRAAWPAADDGTGSGLANLTARVRAAGGQLTVSQAGDRFDLSAEIPLPGPPGPGPATRPAPGPPPDGTPGRPAASRRPVRPGPPPAPRR